VQLRQAQLAEPRHGAREYITPNRRGGGTSPKAMGSGAIGHDRSSTWSVPGVVDVVGDARAARGAARDSEAARGIAVQQEMPR